MKIQSFLLLLMIVLGQGMENKFTKWVTGSWNQNSFNATSLQFDARKIYQYNVERSHVFITLVQSMADHPLPKGGMCIVSFPCWPVDGNEIISNLNEIGFRAYWNYDVSIIIKWGNYIGK